MITWSNAAFARIAKYARFDFLVENGTTWAAEWVGYARYATIKTGWVCGVGEESIGRADEFCKAINDFRTSLNSKMSEEFLNDK